MTVSAQRAFARIHSAHQAFCASYQTDQRPAAIVECNAADVDFMAAMPGGQVWVKADYAGSGLLAGTVSMAFDNGDVRTEHGVNIWGEFCPDTYSPAEAKAFFRAAEESLESACALDGSRPSTLVALQIALLF